MKRLFIPVAFVALLTLVSACKKVDRIEVEPKSVTFSEANKKSDLKATALTADGKPVPDVKFEFSSSDTKVATVDANGTVLSVKSGSAAILVKGGEKSAKVPVEVSIPATIVVKGAPITITGVGTTATVEAELQDDAGRPIQGAKMEFASADPNIVEVSGNTLTSRGAGTATVTAVAGGIKQGFEVTVKQPEVASLTLEGAPKSLKVKQTAMLNVLAKGADGAAIKGITATFASSNAKLATVDATGKVTAVKPGAVTITAKSGDKTAATKITIKKK
ncbi:MAG: Ig-like domain-containing protein [Myxococcaceae bacterium]|nr:Ig-like domain-containing protein [Myxococcaceae bacterium]